MTPESLIRNQICSYLRSKKILCFVHDSVGIYDPTKKVYRTNKNPYRMKGVADILGCLPDGRFLAIEVKTPKGRLTPEQRLFLGQIQASGGVSFVARSIDDVIRGLGDDL